MAGMTPSEVEQRLNTQQQASDQQTDANGNPATVMGSSGYWYSPQEIFDAQIAFGQNQASPDQLRMLQDIDPLDGGITDAQARAYDTHQQKTSADKPMVYHAPTKTRAAYYTDPDTGTAYDLNGNIIAQAPDENAPPYYIAAQGQYYDPSTAPAGAAPEPGNPRYGPPGVDNSYNYAALAQAKQLAEEARAEQIREFNITNPQEEQARQQGFLQNRAVAGDQLGTLQRGLANDAYSRALDPGNFPAYLAASSGLPRSGSSPIDQLLGQGTQIAQPEGSNPLADPRFKSLMDQLYGYAQPQSISTVQNIAAENGGTLPQSFYDYTGTQAPAHAQGGSQMLHEPVIAIGMHTGRPAFIAGEAGDERVDFTPAVHSHSDGGQPIPHSHDRGDQKHEHMDANSPATYADGGTAQIEPYGYDQATPPAQPAQPTDPQDFYKQWPTYTADQQSRIRTIAQNGGLTPAQGTNIALGKGLQAMGWVNNNLVQHLLTGDSPTPGMIDDQTLMRLPPSYRALLQAAIRAQVGSAGLGDYAQSQQDFAMPGLGSSYPTASYA